MKEQDQAETIRAFKEAVNMAPGVLEKWLASEHSNSVGWADGANKRSVGRKEAVGHEAGRKIVAIKRKKKSDLSPQDYSHMKKVIGYVHRHLKQRPAGDVTDTRWRYSLMNWGHDPKHARGTQTDG